MHTLFKREQQKSKVMSGCAVMFVSISLLSRAEASDLAHLAVDAVWMITLGTLGTCQQLALHTLAKAATHHTHVLQKEGGGHSAVNNPE